MRLLVIGGSGKVGSLVLPYLIDATESVRVFDLKPPASTQCEYVAGNVRDYLALKAACEGCDRLLYMAMGSIEGWGNAENVLAHFDVNITGLYLALRAAGESGIKHVAVTSSMSVYDQLGNRFVHDEETAPDAHEHYGLSKRLGEEVCGAACRHWGLSVNALRLCLPVSAEEWQQLAKNGKQSIHTEASDVARALIAALENPFGGFQAFTISGDYAQKTMRLRKAKALLGWEPLQRPEL